jgi:hypothetical protein
MRIIKVSEVCKRHEGCFVIKGRRKVVLELIILVSNQNSFHYLSIK